MSPRRTSGPRQKGITMAVAVSRAMRVYRTVAVSLAALAVAAPAASAGVDTRAPSAPTDTFLVVDYLCTGALFAHWRNSYDDVDSPTQIRYRFYDADGKALRFEYWGTDVPGDVQGDRTAIGETWMGMLPSVRTMRAVDRAGNLSAPAPLNL
jgi:hypothetical protein